MEKEIEKNNEEYFGMYFSISDVVKQTGATLRQLYYWEKLDVFEPRYEKFGLRMYRRYSIKDVNLIKQVVAFLKEGFHLQAAARKAKEAAK
jgi:DNA-binding transcriptional MerR regulator